MSDSKAFPTFKHRGEEITCLSNGYFQATVSVGGDPEVVLTETTLQEVRDGIDRLHQRERRRRARVSVPVYFFNGKNPMEPMEWRGFQSNTGHMLLTNHEGEKLRYKVSLEGAFLVPAALATGDLLNLSREYADLCSRVTDARSALEAAVTEVGVPIPVSYRTRRESEEIELSVRGQLEELVRRAQMKLHVSAR